MNLNSWARTYRLVSVALGLPGNNAGLFFLPLCFLDRLPPPELTIHLTCYLSVLSSFVKIISLQAVCFQGKMTPSSSLYRSVSSPAVHNLNVDHLLRVSLILQGSSPSASSHDSDHPVVTPASDTVTLKSLTFCPNFVAIRSKLGSSSSMLLLVGWRICRMVAFF